MARRGQATVRGVAVNTRTARAVTQASEETMRLIIVSHRHGAAGSEPRLADVAERQLLPRLRSRSRILAHSGHTGYFDGSRLGTQTLPQRARTGTPSTVARVASALRT